MTKDKTKNQKIAIDWAKWVDEDEVDDAPAMPEDDDMNGFGGPGGAGGMDMAQM